MGLYAENVVFNAAYLPIEVKYGNTISDGDISGLDRFTRKHRSSPGIVVSKNRNDFGIRLGTEFPFFIPLLAFLLVFD